MNEGELIILDFRNGSHLDAFVVFVGRGIMFNGYLTWDRSNFPQELKYFVHLSKMDEDERAFFEIVQRSFCADRFTVVEEETEKTS